MIYKGHHANYHNVIQHNYTPHNNRIMGLATKFGQMTFSIVLCWVYRNCYL